MSKKNLLSVPNNGDYEHAYYKSINEARNFDNGVGRATMWENFRYAPYGEGGMIMNAKEIAVGMLEEAILVFCLCIIVVGAASAAAAADIEVRAFHIGIMFGLGLIVALGWEHSDKLPRHLTFGATVAEFWPRGNVNWLLALIILAVQFLAATAAGGVLFATGASSIPIIGTPNITWIGGAFGIQLLGTFILALTVYHKRYNKMHNKGDVGNSGWLYGCAGIVIVAFSYAKFGLYTFNACVYFASACGASFLNLAHPTLYAADPWNQFGAVSGAAALFIMTDVLAWMLAALLCWFIFGADGNTSNESSESPYGGNPVATEYSRATSVKTQVDGTVRKRSQQQSQNVATKNNRRHVNNAHIEHSHNNADDWNPPD